MRDYLFTREPYYVNPREPSILSTLVWAYTYQIANFSVGSSDIRSSVWWAYIPG